MTPLCDQGLPDLPMLSPISSLMPSSMPLLMPQSMPQRGNPPVISMVLHEPEIPGNTGTLLRLASCWGMPLMVIEPLGFVLSDRRFRRSVMDYGVNSIHRWASWADFSQQRAGQGRLVAVTPQASSQRLDAMIFLPGDHLIMGSESGGIPQAVLEHCHASVRIPMQPPCRSMNMALAAAIVWAEALRQVSALPQDHPPGSAALNECCIP